MMTWYWAWKSHTLGLMVQNRSAIVVNSSGHMVHDKTGRYRNDWSMRSIVWRLVAVENSSATLLDRMTHEVFDQTTAGRTTKLLVVAPIDIRVLGQGLADEPVTMKR
jgi:hypothetical protein